MITFIATVLTIIISIHSPSNLYGLDIRAYKFNTAWYLGHNFRDIYPQAIAVDSHNNVYVGFHDLNTVSKYNSKGTLLDQIYMPGPSAIAVDRYDTLYVVNDYEPSIVRIFANGESTRNLYPADTFQSHMRGIAVDNDRGYIYVTSGNTLHKFLLNDLKFHYQIDLGYWSWSVAVDRFGLVHILGS